MCLLLKKLKKIRLLCIFLITLSLTLFFSNHFISADASDVIIDQNNFPDKNFRTLVSEFDINNDGVLQKYEITKVTEIEANEKNISNLKGLHYFTNLKYLYCSNNQLTQLDTSENVKLMRINCENNSITDINLKNNSNLEFLDCSNNNLTTVNVSNNTKLKSLDIENNILTSLDLKNNLNLIDLKIRDNLISNLDLSKNKSIEYLLCSNNQIKNINFCNDNNIDTLICANNVLESLDISECKKLKKLECEKNQLSSLNTSKNIQLNTLYCSTNRIKHLDLSNNKLLNELKCSGNKLDELNVNNNTAIKLLEIGGNNISTIDLTKNSALIRLSIDWNNISELDLSNNIALRFLYCQKNKIHTLDLKNNPKLTELYCAMNNIDVLDLSHNTEIEYLECGDNNLTSLNLKNNRKLVYSSLYQQIYDIKDYIKDNTFDLNLLPGDFDINKVHNLKGALIKGKTLILEKDIENVYYDYDTDTRDRMQVKLVIKNIEHNKKTAKINFEANGGGGEMESIVVKINSEFKLPKCTYIPPKNKAFKAWSINGKVLNVADTIMVNGDTTIKALWTDEDENKNSGNIILDRLGGSDRISTSVYFSKNYYKKANCIVLARNDIFADALSASPFASSLDCPILLSKTNTLDSTIVNEIRRLGVQKVYIVGGENAISNDVVNSLKKLGLETIRIAGNDRYETSSMIASKLAKKIGKNGKAIVTNGESFADALSISPYSSKTGLPILLVRKNEVPVTILKTINELNIQSVYIIGENMVVSKSVEKQLPNVIDRIGGENRYETSALIAEKFFSDSKQAFVASGQTFADALIVGPIAGKNDSPILLTKKNSLPLVIMQNIKIVGYENIVIAGLDGAVSKRVQKIIETMN